MQENSDFIDLYRPKDGYVFVVTYGRSGSTLTLNYLNSFPGYCIRGENNNVIFPLCSAITNLNNENFQVRRKNKSKPISERGPEMQRIMETPRDPWYGAELVDPERFAKGIFNSFVKEILSPPDGVRVSGFKEIQWANSLGRLKINLDLIAKYFPNARFIFQTRSYDAVAKSGWWTKRPQHEVKQYIENADAAFLNYASENSSCVHIRYEDLAEDCGGFRKLAGFLGEDYCSETAQKIVNEKLTHLKEKA
ncbi:sulfotransferase [Paracoccus pantotrophus]|uniref:sulfotransferase n=1 Tax=Paracoccus pantotrophus TaxID=82367 RepID=UPI0009DDC0BE|nr:sulfotransferase [Paracoccus pantotrophus]